MLLRSSTKHWIFLLGCPTLPATLGRAIDQYGHLGHIVDVRRRHRRGRRDGARVSDPVMLGAGLGPVYRVGAGLPAAVSGPDRTAVDQGPGPVDLLGTPQSIEQDVVRPDPRFRRPANAPDDASRSCPIHSPSRRAGPPSPVGFEHERMPVSEVDPVFGATARISDMDGSATEGQTKAAIRPIAARNFDARAAQARGHDQPEMAKGGRPEVARRGPPSAIIILTSAEGVRKRVREGPTTSSGP